MPLYMNAVDLFEPLPEIKPYWRIQARLHSFLQTAPGSYTTSRKKRYGRGTGDGGREEGRAWLVVLRRVRGSVRRTTCQRAGRLGDSKILMLHVLRGRRAILKRVSRQGSSGEHCIIHPSPNFYRDTA